MRWLPYFILAYLAVGLQVGMGQLIAYRHAAPDFVLLIVVFIAVNAPREQALIGCLILGLLQDLLPIQPMGLYAVAYSLVGLFVVGTQAIVYREHPLTHFSLVLMGGLMVACVLLLHGWIHPIASAREIEGAVTAPARLAPATLFTSALYTAVLAPLVLGALQRIKRVFNFAPTRRRHRS